MIVGERDTPSCMRCSRFKASSDHFLSSFYISIGAPHFGSLLQRTILLAMLWQGVHSLDSGLRSQSNMSSTHFETTLHIIASEKG